MVLLCRCQDISSFFHFCHTKIDEEDAKTCHQFVKLPTLVHMKIFIHLIYLYLGLWDIQTRSVRSVVRFYLAKNSTLIVNSISNLEQTDKSVCYESDEIINSFWKKPVGISHACRLPLCWWKYYYSFQGNQAAIEIVQ